MYESVEELIDKWHMKYNYGRIVASDRPGLTPYSLQARRASFGAYGIDENGRRRVRSSLRHGHVYPRNIILL